MGDQLKLRTSSLNKNKYHSLFNRHFANYGLLSKSTRAPFSIYLDLLGLLPDLQLDAANRPLSKEELIDTDGQCDIGVWFCASNPNSPSNNKKPDETREQYLKTYVKRIRIYYQLIRFGAKINKEARRWYGGNSMRPSDLLKFKQEMLKPLDDAFCYIASILHDEMQDEREMIFFNTNLILNSFAHDVFIYDKKYIYSVFYDFIQPFVDFCVENNRGSNFEFELMKKFPYFIRLYRIAPFNCTRVAHYPDDNCFYEDLENVKFVTAASLFPFMTFAIQAQTESSRKKVYLSKDVISIHSDTLTANQLTTNLVSLINSIQSDYIKTIQTYIFPIHELNHFYICIFHRSKTSSREYETIVLNNSKSSGSYITQFKNIFESVLQSHKDSAGYTISSQTRTKIRSQISNSCGPASIENMFVYMVDVGYESNHHYMNDFIKFIRRDNELSSNHVESNQTKIRKLLYVSSFLKTIEHSDAKYVCPLPDGLLKDDTQEKPSNKSSKKRALDETQDPLRKQLYDDLNQFIDISQK